MARYSFIWNVDVVLDYLRELTPLSVSEIAII